MIPEVRPVHSDNFHLVFEELGYIAGSTEYLLVTMQVNVTELVNAVQDLKETIEIQHQTIRGFVIENKGEEQALYPIKEKLLESLVTHAEDADLLMKKVNHIKNTLPHVPTPSSTQINAENQDRTGRPKRFIQILWGILGTYKGIMDNRRYNRLSEALKDTQAQVSKLVNVVNNQAKIIAVIQSELSDLKTSIDKQAILHSLNIETKLRSANIRITAEVDRITRALQTAQWKRLSIDFLSSTQLDQLYARMISKAQDTESELLISQPSDLLQLELSYFFNGESITFLLHVPTVPKGAMLRLIKLHPFPLPLSGNYSIIPDISDQVLAISVTDTPEMSIQFSALDLLGCNQANHVYLCEKLGALNKEMTDTCLGALYKQQFDKARILCPMKIVASGELLYRLANNKHLAYSPFPQTLAVTCRGGYIANHQVFLLVGVTEFTLPAGCRTTLASHYIFADNSIASDSGLEHLTLGPGSLLEIPQLTPANLEIIMAKMEHDGQFRPSMNDIIEAHEHLEELNNRTPIIASITFWIITFIIFIIIIAYLFPIISQIKYLRSTFYRILNLKDTAAYRTFIEDYFVSLITKPHPTPAITTSDPNSNI